MTHETLSGVCEEQVRMSDETRSKADTVRAMFDSYLRQDRDLAERLLADVFVMYEHQLKTGERHRNVELITVLGEQITEAQVFFGGRYPEIERDITPWLTTRPDPHPSP